MRSSSISTLLACLISCAAFAQPFGSGDRAAWYAEKRPTLTGSNLRDYDAVIANYARLDAWSAECDAFFPALRALAKPVPHRYELRLRACGSQRRDFGD